MSARKKAAAETPPTQGGSIAVPPQERLPAAPVPAAPRAIELHAKPGETAARALARAAAAPFMTGASTVMDFGQAAGMVQATEFGEIVAVLEGKAAAVNGGDLSESESVLAVQAASLDAIFNAMARRAAMNVDKSPQATETFLRMALRAQAQCRATIETLATIKNPPVLFARQANINNGGQQQVNNDAAGSATDTRVRAERADGVQQPPNELLEGCHGKRMDAGAPGANGRANQGVEAVEQGHRPAHGGRQGSIEHQRPAARIPVSSSG
ncbi:MAG: hypothetical protein KGK18_10295 [Burkholderiales bacterium]|nr:hypothetical protein [Burkholderiales bacterium]